MKRSASFTLVILLGTIFLLALALRPASGTAAGSAGSLPLLPTIDIRGLQAEAEVITPIPTPAAAPPSFPTPLPMPELGSPALAVNAAELQAPVEGSEVVLDSSAPSAEGWNPPALPVPLARHPFDHYWMIRPVAANFRNSGLSYYPYGSNGPGDNLRVHHGTDISNPIGVEVMAAAPGTVVWADKGHVNEYESITAYGNTVVIQHDYGYEGQLIWTLYAHLAVILVDEGDRVQMGDVIGLIGNTGQVTGPHVHFEVRVGRNSYYEVRNPDLWMAPYVGTGVVAGRVEMSNGQPIYDAEVELISVDKGYVTHRTTTYAGSGVKSDDNWRENFVIPDVPIGLYRVTVTWGDTVWEGQVEVAEGMTNLVELTIASAAAGR